MKCLASGALALLMLLPFAALRAEETAAELEASGIAALKQSQTQPNLVVPAAIYFAKAVNAYEKSGEQAKATDMNSFLYWCKKKMTLQQMDVFLKQKDADVAAIKRFEAIDKAAPPPDKAQEYFDRAGAFAKSRPAEHLLIAIRFYEVAERFKGTDLSLKAQDRSLQEMQRAFMETKANVAAVPKGTAASVINSIDPVKDSVHGEWALENGVLRSFKHHTYSRVKLPFVPGTEYDLRIVFKRVDGKSDIGVVLSTGGQQALLSVGGWGNEYGGVSFVDDQNGRENNNGTKLTIDVGTVYDLRVSVREGSIKATLNDETIVDMVTTGKKLTLSNEMTMGAKNELGVVANKSNVDFTIVEVTDVSGNGQFTAPVELAEKAPQAPEAAAEKPAKIPVPNAAQQKDAEALIRSIFKDEFAAKTAADKAALAKKLELQFGDKGNDAPAKYMLLQLAAGLHAQAGDLEQFLALSDKLDAGFEGDNKAARKAGLGLVAANSKNPAVAKTATALRTLFDKPDDPTAGVTAGKYYCFAHGDFERGLPLLAKGSHVALKALAARELAAPTENAEWLALADAWWDFSDKVEKTEKEEKRGSELRALFWYRKALEKTTGLARMKIEKRIAAIEPPPAPAPGPAANETKAAKGPATPPASVPQGLSIPTGGGQLKGAVVAESVTIGPGIFDLSGTISTKGNVTITIAAGTTINNGSFDLNAGTKLRAEGTDDAPAAFRNVIFGQDNGSLLAARSASFDGCKFRKIGSWFGYFSTRWQFEACLLNNCAFAKLSGVDYGFEMDSCAFVGMTFPEVTHKNGPDTAKHLRREWNRIGCCAFLNCQVPPTVFWCGEQCSYVGCKFLPGAAYEGDDEPEFEAFIVQCTGNPPTASKGNPLIINQAKQPYPGPFIPQKAPADLLAKARLVTDMRKQYKWISKDALYTASSQFHEQAPSPKLLNGIGDAWEGDHSFHTEETDDPFIVIDLGAKHSVSALDIENRRNDKDKRADTLTCWVSDSADGPWTEVWRAKELQTHWAVVLPKPVSARYVKLGLRHKAFFHLNRVRVFEP